MMVDDINFLPAGYHRTRDRRKAQVWRRGAFAVFVLLIFAGGAKQWHSRRALEANRDELRQRAAETLARLGPAEPLQARIAQLDARADLFARLRIRIPPTRLIADVTRSLPEFVSLTEFRVLRERAVSRLDAPPAPAGPPASPATLTPVESDLAALELIEKQSNVVVSIAGVAPDDVAISHLLAALQATGSFDEVQLLYTDETTLREHRLRSFSLRLVTRRPGRFGPQSPASSLGMRSPQ